MLLLFFFVLQVIKAPYYCLGNTAFVKVYIVDTPTNHSTSVEVFLDKDVEYDIFGFKVEIKIRQGLDDYIEHTAVFGYMQEHLKDQTDVQKRLWGTALQWADALTRQSLMYGGVQYADIYVNEGLFGLVAFRLMPSVKDGKLTKTLYLEQLYFLETKKMAGVFKIEGYKHVSIIAVFNAIALHAQLQKIIAVTYVVGAPRSSYNKTASFVNSGFVLRQLSKNEQVAVRVLNSHNPNQESLS